MKVSDVYGRVGLTERAVRLYIREGLVKPSQTDGIAVFDKAGVVRLEQIAALRRADFSIDQIRRMLENPDAVNAVVNERKSKLIGRGGEAQSLLATLNAAQTFSSVEQLVRVIGGAASPESIPVRNKFDEPVSSEMEVEQEWQAVEAVERRRGWLRKLLPICIVAAVLAVLLFLFSFDNWLENYAGQNKEDFRLNVSLEVHQSAPEDQQRMKELVEKDLVPTFHPWNDPWIAPWDK